MVDYPTAAILVEFAITSFLMTKLLIGRSSPVRVLIFSASTLFTLIPLFGYVSDSIGMGVTPISLGILCSPVLALLFLISRRRPIHLEWDSSTRQDILGLLTVVAFCFALGLIPSWPSLYPTGVGDTSHHAALALWIDEANRLPHSHAEYYPLVEVGLFAQTMWMYPAGMHIMLALIATLSGKSVLQFITPLHVLVGSLTGVAVYALAPRKDSLHRAIALVAGFIAYFGGSPMALAIVAGSLSTVWGLFFVASAIVGICEYNARPERRRLIFLALPIVGLTLYYSLYVQLLILIFFLSVPFTRKHKWFYRAMFSSMLLLISMGLASLFRIYGGGLEYFDFAITYVTLLVNLLTFPLCIPLGALLAVLSSIGFLILYTPTRERLRSVMRLDYNIILAALTLLAMYGYVKTACPTWQKGIIYSYYLTTTYFWVPGYNYEVVFGSALILIVGALTCTSLSKIRVISLSLVPALIIANFYYQIDWTYYYSKYVFVISVISFALLPNVLASLKVKFHSGSQKYSIARKIVVLLFIILLISMIVAEAGAGVNTLRQTSIAITPSEEEALLWMKRNYVQIFGSDTYKFYVSADVNKAVWFEAITEHSFNRDHFPSGYSLPPFPISYNLEEWLKFARVGEVIVLDSTYGDPLVSYLQDQKVREVMILVSPYDVRELDQIPPGSKISVKDRLFEIVAVYPPLVFVKKIC